VPAAPDITDSPAVPSSQSEEEPRKYGRVPGGGPVSNRPPREVRESGSKQDSIDHATSLETASQPREASPHRDGAAPHLEGQRESRSKRRREKRKRRRD